MQYDWIIIYNFDHEIKYISVLHKLIDVVAFLNLLSLLVSHCSVVNITVVVFFWTGPRINDSRLFCFVAEVARFQCCTLSQRLMLVVGGWLCILGNCLKILHLASILKNHWCSLLQTIQISTTPLDSGFKTYIRIPSQSSSEYWLEAEPLAHLNLKQSQE